MPTRVDTARAKFFRLKAEKLRVQRILFDLGVKIMMANFELQAAMYSPDERPVRNGGKLTLEKWKRCHANAPK